MMLITKNDELKEFCTKLSTAEFVTVDTEFLRDKTYWPILCLVQLGGPDDAAAIDALAEGLDLEPLFDLMRNNKILKVFHAGRQDFEIFFRQMGELPNPVFDTQVSAMVCGFGDSVGYETLVSQLARKSIDKTMRFTDWGRRPLSEKKSLASPADLPEIGQTQWTLVLGTFTEISRATEFAAMVKPEPGLITKVVVAGKTRYRVSTKPLSRDRAVGPELAVAAFNQTIVKLMPVCPTGVHTADCVALDRALSGQQATLR